MKTDKTYYTITKPYINSHTVKGSKFIAILLPFKNQDQFKIELMKVQKDYPKARHYCYAWKLGNSNDRFRTFDDGEPSGTAGKPILNQIESAGLINVILIVVRYFGGILLGASGLTKAYKDAAKLCISNAERLPFLIQFEYEIFTESAKIQTLIGILKTLNINIVDFEIHENSHIRFILSELEEAFYLKKIKSKMEKINIDQIEDFLTIANCRIIKRHLR